MPPFDALVEFAAPSETAELICRISSSNDDEPVLELLAAVLVGVVSALLLTVDAAELPAWGAEVVPELALVADESVPLFEALAEFTAPSGTVELICRISSSSDDEPVLELLAAVLVGVVPALLLTVGVPELPAWGAEVVPELALVADESVPLFDALVEFAAPLGTGEPPCRMLSSNADKPVSPEAVAICDPSVGASEGTGGGPPWLPSTPGPATCCWRSLKSVCKSFNKVWKSLPSDELLELDDESPVAGEPVPLFDALGEFAPPSGPGELSCRISSSNDDEPVFGLLAAVLVGVVPALLPIEKLNRNRVSELLMLPMLMYRNPLPSRAESCGRERMRIDGRLFALIRLNGPRLSKALKNV